MKYVLLFTLLIVGGAIFVTACQKDDLRSDKEKIEEYLTENNLTAEEHSTGFYYIIDKQGSGGNPNISSTVEVKYKGYLLDGTVFDQTQGDATIEFPLSNLISGWQVAIPLLQPGGSGTFFFPSALGYGSQAVGSIPANSVLIFEIELVSFR